MIEEKTQELQFAAVQVVKRFKDSEPHTWDLDDLDSFGDLVDTLHLALIDLTYVQVIKIARHED